MDKLVLEASKDILTTGCAKVALVIDEYLHVSVDAGAEHIGSNVELASMDQQWVVNIFLYYARPPAIRGGVLYDALDFIEFPCDLDAVTPVRVLTWFDDPDVLRRSWRLVILRLLYIFLLIRATGRLLRALSVVRFGLYHLLLLLSLLAFQLGRRLLVLDVVLELEIEMPKSLELRVVEPRFDVEGQRYVFEDIGIHCLVIVLHIQEEGLLVVDVEVVFYLVI